MRIFGVHVQLEITVAGRQPLSPLGVGGYAVDVPVAPDEIYPLAVGRELRREALLEVGGQAYHVACVQVRQLQAVFLCRVGKDDPPSVGAERGHVAIAQLAGKQALVGPVGGHRRHAADLAVVGGEDDHLAVRREIKAE